MAKRPHSGGRIKARVAVTKGIRGQHARRLFRGDALIGLGLHTSMLAQQRGGDAQQPRADLAAFKIKTIPALKGDKEGF